ncbi:MAG: DUF2851 family protein [Haliscomenobacteraceae bacterium CHB4]|nr:DUF2851 family protein [Haliscomenobacteraceae bacterium CHB4]
MRESFLHFLWRWRRFDAQTLRTTDGQSLEILHPGEWNGHAGPDFFNARVRIGDTIWAGNVEMHLRASEWMLHRHSTDAAYDNVVLHVVLEEDQPVARASGERIPCLELKGRIPPKILENYQRLEHERAWIPCRQFFKDIPGIVRLNWLDRLLVERLEQKTAAVAEMLAATENHWEEAFYRLLARNFGLKVNAEPFEALARSLPLLILAKHKNDAKQIEALLFGQAGMLDGAFKDEWPKALAQEYRFLKHKYDLMPMASSQWKFLRLRPANFPTVRLAQFAALVHQSAHLFSKILEAKNMRELENLFDVQPGEYWLTHFQFDKPSVRRPKNTGRDFVHLLIINTIAPFLFHYGKMREQEAFQKRALSLLEELPPEANAIVDGWAELGVQARHAYQTQALIHLKTRYCDAKRCLECAMGNAILK